MATSHYKKIVVDYLKSKNVEFVSKDENAPNVPHLRPIEKFWAICKQEYKKLENPPKNISDVSSEWKKIRKEVGEKFGKNLMKNLKKDIREAAKKGTQKV